MLVLAVVRVRLLRAVPFCVVYAKDVYNGADCFFGAGGDSRKERCTVTLELEIKTRALQHSGCD